MIDSKIRETFEKSISKQYMWLHVFSFVMHPNQPRYLELMTELCYLSWKAALAQQASEEAKPIGIRVQSADGCVDTVFWENIEQVAKIFSTWAGHKTSLLYAAPAYTAPRNASVQLAQQASDEPEWIVNDMGELGVKVGGRFFFLYKGGNIEYENGVHDCGTPVLYRMVGKREFGETCCPLQWVVVGTRQARYTQELTYTPGLSDGNPEDGNWKPLPTLPKEQAK